MGNHCPRRSQPQADDLDGSGRSWSHFWPEVDQAWAGLWVPSTVPHTLALRCSRRLVPLLGGFRKYLGVLLFVTVFGTVNGSGNEGAGVVLAMRRGHPFQNPLVLHRETSIR